MQRILVSFSLLLSAFAVQAGPAVASAPVELTAHTTVYSPKTGYARVELAQRVEFARMKARISGRGRAIGFLLVSDDPLRKRGKVTEISSVGFRFCARQACSDGRLVQGRLWPHRLQRVGNRLFVPAGAYRLYVISDGAPAKVELRLPGLPTGRTALKITEDARGGVRSPEVIYRETNGKTLLSAGEERPFKGRGIAYMVLWHEGEHSAGGLIGDCEYERKPPPPQLAWAPGCPEADWTYERTSEQTLEPYETYLASTFHYLPHAIGMYYLAPVGVADAGITSFWLKYE